MSAAPATGSAVRAASPWRRLAAILAYTLRSCLPARRRLALLVPCAGAVAFGALARVVEDTPARSFANVAAEAIFSLAVPIAALMVGDAVMGAEVRAGTFHVTWLSPARPWEIVVGRWLGGSALVAAVVAPSCALAAVVAGAPEAAGPAFVAGLAGGVAYVAVFVAVGCVTRRTAVWSLAIVFLVERLLGEALTAIAQISPTWQARAAFVGLIDEPPSRLLREGIPQGGAAVGRLAIVTAVALAVAMWRMRHLRLAGASD